MPTPESLPAAPSSAARRAPEARDGGGRTPHDASVAVLEPAAACAGAPAGHTRRRRVAAFVTLLIAASAGAVQAAPAASAATATPAASAIRYALSKLGDPYKYGAKGPSAFDCSGLTKAAYAAAGIALPRISRDQYRLLHKVPRSGARPGDLVFWGTSKTSSASVYHVALYLGSGMILDAGHTGTVVQVRAVWTAQIMPYVARPSTTPMLLPVEVGSVGDDVRAVQLRLRANGYAVLANGAYATPTATAIRSLQRRLGVSATGLVGAATWGYLVTHGVRTHVS